MSRDECLTADWRLIGFEDGASGSSPVQIGERRKACAKHGVTPDKTAYDQGYQEGLAVFCSYNRGLGAGKSGAGANRICPPESDYQAGYDEGLRSFCNYDVGYTEGISGKRYNRVCPPELEEAFLSGYDFGSHIHSLRTELRSLEARRDTALEEQTANEQRIETIKERIAYEESLDGNQRAELLEEIEETRERNAELAGELFELEERMASLRHELRRVDTN